MTPSTLHERTNAGPSLWHNHDYLLLMSGKTTQIIGAGLTTFAVPLVAYALTGSVLWASMVAAAGQLGYLVAALPAGAIADRVDRRKLLIVCSALGMILFATVYGATAMSVLTAWHLATVLFLTSVVASFFGPAEAGGIREVVRADQMGSAMAAMQGRSAVASLISGPVGGIFYAIGRAIPFLGTTIGYVVVFVCTIFVKGPLNGDLAHTRGISARQSLAEGLRYVMAVKFLRTGVAIFAVINLAFSGVLFTLNLHLVQIATQPLLIGLIDAAAGASMLLGSLIAGPLVKRIPAGRLAVMGMIVALIGSTGMAFSTQYWEYLAWVAFATILIPATNAALLGYASVITPSRLQGRMNSVLVLSSVAVGPIAPVIAGTLLSLVGVNVAMGIFAGLFLVGAAVLALYRPISSIGTPDTWEADLVEWPPTASPPRSRPTIVIN